MGEYVGDTDICYIGGNTVGDDEDISVYVGDTQVFPCGPPPPKLGLFAGATFGSTELSLPLTDAGVNPAAAWSLEFEAFAIDAYQTQQITGPGGDGTFEVQHQIGATAAEVGSNHRVLGDVYILGAVNGFWNDFFHDPPIHRYGQYCKALIEIDPVGNSAQLTLTNLDGDTDTWEFDDGDAVYSLTLPATMTLFKDSEAYTSFRNVILRQGETILGNWPIDDNVGDAGEITDISGNANHGTLITQGTAVWDYDQNRSICVRFKVMRDGIRSLGPDDFIQLYAFLRDDTDTVRTVQGEYSISTTNDPYTPAAGLEWNSDDECWEFRGEIDITINPYTTDLYLIVNLQQYADENGTYYIWGSDYFQSPGFWRGISDPVPAEWYDSADAAAFSDYADPIEIEVYEVLDSGVRLEDSFTDTSGTLLSAHSPETAPVAAQWDSTDISGTIVNGQICAGNTAGGAVGGYHTIESDDTTPILNWTLAGPTSIDGIACLFNIVRDGGGAITGGYKVYFKSSTEIAIAHYNGSAWVENSKTLTVPEQTVGTVIHVRKASSYIIITCASEDLLLEITGDIPAYVSNLHGFQSNGTTDDLLGHIECIY